MTLPGCLCAPIPGRLYQTSADETADFGEFQDCVYEYVPKPPEYADLFIGSPIFLSTASFVDREGDTFRYLFRCNVATFTVQRVYAESINGSPYASPTAYSWSLGVAGNECDPFELTVGEPYVGGPAGLVMTLTGDPITTRFLLTVTDPDDLPIDGVVLSASKAGEPTIERTIDATGVEDFGVSAAGDWSIQLTKTGYVTSTETHTAVLDQTTPISRVLTPVP